VSEAAIVRVEGVRKRFGRVVAVDDVSLEIPRNAFFALLGPSGCGKTTLLRMIAGFERPDAGRILIDGEDTAGVPPNRRLVNMVFQSYAVFPHMTVAKNIAYGLEVTGTPRAEIARRVAEAVAMVRLEGLEDRRPDQLSGGQKQRVALARALVKRPKLLLLDEPLSALDRKLREEMQLELVRLQHEVGITFVIVTHDQDEALSMATGIAVMDRGRVLQVADPVGLYERPRTAFVADFIGAANLLEVRGAEPAPSGWRVKVPGFGWLEVADVGPRPVALALRPEKIGHTGDGAAVPPDAVTATGRVVQIAYFGDYSRLFVALEGASLVCYHYNRRRDAAAPRPGDRVQVWFLPRDAVPLEA
jgi:spermidine/putrescine ABC transporter ATP-binding subunit